jgi:hypothetical protein
VLCHYSSIKVADSLEPCSVQYCSVFEVRLIHKMFQRRNILPYSGSMLYHSHSYSQITRIIISPIKYSVSVLFFNRYPVAWSCLVNDLVMMTSHPSFSMDLHGIMLIDRVSYHWLLSSVFTSKHYTWITAVNLYSCQCTSTQLYALHYLKTCYTVPHCRH